MSVYNGEKYLRESIDSILIQTFNDFEFLIINDDSTDSSRDIILSYDDSRITLVDNKENMGLSKSLNIGIHRSRGEYIARQDADDLSHPDRLKMQYGYMEKNNCDVICCKYQYMDKRGKRLLWVSGMFSAQSVRQTLIDLKDPIAHGSVLMKKNSLIETGGYNEFFEFSQDYELWLRLLSTGKRIECIDYVGYYHRLLPHANKTKINAQRRYASMVTDYYVKHSVSPNPKLLKIRNGLMPERGLNQTYRESFLQECFYWCNIGRIQLKGLLNRHSINSHQP
jgi:glycosyltransferase involved in cell wall biosynthesis|tara:strand:- start:383 stop:1225 length:843 start_codon:yes stop_codon:yes gene_type:complete